MANDAPQDVLPLFRAEVIDAAGGIESFSCSRIEPPTGTPFRTTGAPLSFPGLTETVNDGDPARGVSTKAGGIFESVPRSTRVVAAISLLVHRGFPNAVSTQVSTILGKANSCEPLRPPSRFAQPRPAPRPASSSSNHRPVGEAPGHGGFGRGSRGWAGSRDRLRIWFGAGAFRIPSLLGFSVSTGRPSTSKRRDLIVAKSVRSRIMVPFDYGPSMVGVWFEAAPRFLTLATELGGVVDRGHEQSLGRQSCGSGSVT